MKPQINFNTLLIVAGFAVLIWLHGCAGGHVAQKSDVGGDTIHSETVIRYDTVIHQVLTHHIYYSDTGRVHAPTIIHDISFVVRDYFTEHHFSDTISNDSIEASYSGMIWKGSMFDPVFKYRWKLPTTTINNTIIRPAELHNKVYLGGFASLSGMVPAIGALLSIENKRERILTIGYGTGPMYFLGAQLKISFRRNHPP